MLLCLELLNRNRLIHCDLKPENVLLKQQGRSGIKVGPLGRLVCHPFSVYLALDVQKRVFPITELNFTERLLAGY